MFPPRFARKWKEFSPMVNFLRKAVDLMAMIYVALIIKGKRTYKSVPATLKAKVKEILIDLDMPELVEE